MHSNRRDKAENAALRQFQAECSEIVNDVSRILDDAGENTCYTGYFHAFPPWTKVDLSTGDVSFSEKLSNQLHIFDDQFLSKIRFDVATYRDKRCVFLHFSSKADFDFFVQNSSIPLQRLYGKSAFDGAWTRMECLNIIEWYNYPSTLGKDRIIKDGDVRKLLNKHYASFLSNIRVINIDRNTGLIRVEFSRDITSSELDQIRSHPYAKADKVSVSGLWFNKLYSCRHCSSTAHHHQNCKRAKALYQICHTNRIYKPEGLKSLAKLVGATSATLGIPYSAESVQKTSSKAITFIYNSKRALLDKKEINLSFVSRRCPPNGPYGSQLAYLSDLDAFCGRCAWRKNSRSCNCDKLTMLNEGLKLSDFMDPRPAPDDPGNAKPANPNPPKSPPKPAPKSKPYKPNPQSQSKPNPQSHSKPNPPAQAVFPQAFQKLPPPKPPDPMSQGQAAKPPPKPPIIKETITELKDVRTSEELKAYVKFHGAEYKRGVIKENVTKAFLADIQGHKQWESFKSRSEAVFGDTINFPGIGFSYGSPEKFRKASFWKPSISEAASEIAVAFGNIMPPNLGAVESYQAGDACPRHKDREKECREEGYTIIIAVGGPRIFKFANQLHKGPNYIECDFHMADGDVMYIPKVLNYGKHSVFHYKEKTGSPHYSLVLKHAKPPSMF